MTEINSRGLLRNKQYGFRPGHGTTLRLDQLIEKSGENLTGSGLLAQFFLMLLKHSIPCESNAFFSSYISWISRRTW